MTATLAACAVGADSMSSEVKMSKPDERLIRPIKYPKQEVDTHRGASHRTADEIARINQPLPVEPVPPQQTAFMNRYFNGGA
uniref:Uncharacterized protein n=1 Tax=Micrococcus phage Kurnik TaxID=3092208 RepID=A0AAU6R602_9CAUD